MAQIKQGSMANQINDQEKIFKSKSMSQFGKNKNQLVGGLIINQIT